MSKDKWQGPDLFLLKNILGDDNAPTVKQQISDKRFFAFSAPPVLFDISYKIQDELQNWDFDQPQSPMHELPKEKMLKKNDQPIQLYSPQITPQRSKPQGEDKQLSIFTMTSNPESFYESSNSESEQMMNNLGQVCLWARDQNGSRTVQNIIEGNNDMQKETVFSLIFPESYDLIKDRFGNYVFQKLFEKGLPQHKALIIESMRGRFIEFSEHPYGCRVVQKLIESIESNATEQQLFLKDINPYALRLIQNQNGNHVIQKCFEVFPIHIMDSIVYQIISELPKLAFHAYGCRVIQKYLENSEPSERPKIVLDKLLEMAVSLSKCQYGNYVMQYIVSHCSEEQTEVLKIFLKNFVDLSSDKYASNVVQKTIKYSPQEFKDEVGQFLSNKNVKDLIYLSKNQFGNYVIQNLYLKLSKEVRMAMKGKLKENHIEISKSQYGRHVLMQLDKIR